MRKYWSYTAMLLGLIAAGPASSTRPESEFGLVVQASQTPLKVDNDGGMLVIDGHKTEIKYSSGGPAIFRGSDNVFVLLPESGQYTIWDRRSQKVTGTLDGTLLPIGSRGLIATAWLDRGERMRVVDVDAQRGEFRTRWTGEKGEYVSPAGASDEALWFVRMVADGRKQTHSLMRLGTDGTSKVVVADLQDWRCTYDSVRGTRVLVYRGQIEIGFPKPGQKPPQFEVGVLDMTTGKVRSLGEVDGGWCGSHALGHSALRVGWLDPKNPDIPAPEDEHTLNCPPVRVREDTEAVELPKK